MINCPFLPVFYQYHQSKKIGKAVPVPENYSNMENVWMSFHGLGMMEVFQFMYTECSSPVHLQEWLIALKGAQQVQEATAAFIQWTQQPNTVTDTTTDYNLLNDDQLQHWQEHGYLKVSGLVDEPLCDAVIQLICSELSVDLSLPATWYSNNPSWHGLMLQVYQHESIHAIRTLSSIRGLFAELYNTSHIIANTEKVSFNPPETASWKFAHQKLHWDINFRTFDPYYIQGLVYLNDVPADRGALTVVPGFHLQFDEWMRQYPDAHHAQVQMQQTLSGTPIPGKKGDIILWRHTLPHAASANHSDLPRFVQYISFSKL